MSTNEHICCHVWTVEHVGTLNCDHVCTRFKGRLCTFSNMNQHVRTRIWTWRRFLETPDAYDIWIIYIFSTYIKIPSNNCKIETNTLFVKTAFNCAFFIHIAVFLFHCKSVVTSEPITTLTWRKKWKLSNLNETINIWWLLLRGILIFLLPPGKNFNGIL